MDQILFCVIFIIFWSLILYFSLCKITSCMGEISDDVAEEVPVRSSLVKNEIGSSVI